MSSLNKHIKPGRQQPYVTIEASLVESLKERLRYPLILQTTPVIGPRGLWTSLLVLVSLSVFVVTAGCGGGETSASETSVDGLPPQFQRVAEVWEILEREHIGGKQLDGQQLSDGAIRGMMQALDDPYAAFLTPDQFDLHTSDIQGFFEGIGAEVSVRDGNITILAPMPDTPAEKAGILPGDIILEIEGESTQGISLMEAVAKIRGEEGTSVELLILHLNNSQPVLITITRGVIPLESVRLLMQVGQIGHLRLFTFAGTSDRELSKALERFERSKGLGLVLDLRNNPGGLLSSVVDVTSQFIDGGLVLYQVDAQGNRTEWEAKSGGNAKDIPMVVLVNEFSASASEVFVGAMMDHDRATVIGTTTFGKGSINNVWPLTDGSGVNFTIAHWFTPNGVLIEGEGISPDIVQEASEDESEDRQLDRAIEILQEQLARDG